MTNQKAKNSFKLIPKENFLGLTNGNLLITIQPLVKRRNRHHVPFSFYL